MKTLWNWYWNTLSLKGKVVLSLIVIVIGGTAFFWSCRSTIPTWHSESDYKAKEGENNILREENAALRKERDDLKAKGDAKDLLIDGLNADLAKFSKQAADGAKAQQEAADQYEKDTAIIGIDIPKLERCQRYCFNRAGLGYPCKPDTATYCSRYAGQ